MMALTVLHILVLILVDFLILQPSESAHINTMINVSSKAGRDNESCLTNFSQPCRTLGYVLERLENFTLVQISNGLYNLDKNYNITNKQNISFIGESSEVLIKCNRSKECGLWFQRCEEIVFDNLTFDGCGHLQSTSPFVVHGSVYQFYAGISFTYCKNLQIDGCTFKNSRGIAMVLYDTGGIVNVSGSHFVNNRAERDNISLAGDLDRNITNSGGGIFLHLTLNGSHHLYNNNHNSSYTVSHSIFQENRYTENITCWNQIPTPFGGGAGLTAYICGSAQNNSLIIDSCHFISNEAIFGGGVFVEFHNEAQGNSVSFINNTFLKNKAIYGGGAVRTGNNIIEKGSTTFKENTIKYVDNRFYQNTATLGGALSHYGWTYHQQSVNDDRKISFKKCHFMGNTATMGSAIAVALNDKNRWMEMGNEMPYALELTNCTVEKNVANHVKKKVIGMGAVYTSRVPCILKGTNTFYNNSNTALLLDNAPLKVYDETLFIENKGYKGGALAMIGLTRLIMTKDSHLLFKCNDVKERGGAIYIRPPGPDVAPFNTTKLRRHDCFIVYEDNGKLINVSRIQFGEWHTKLDFINNSAPFLYGNSVYATTLQSCYLEHEHSRRNKAFEWKGVIYYSGNTEEEISTDPVAIVFNASDWSSLAPYEKFDASIQLLDEKNSTVAGVVKIKVTNKIRRLESFIEPVPSLVPDSSLFIVHAFKSGNKTISVVSGLRVKGIVGQNFTLEILTSCSGQVVSTISDEMKLRNCLEGFHQTDQKAKSQGKCVCMNDTQSYHEGVSRCSDDGKSVYLKTGYWGEWLRHQRDFITYPCPPDYCNFDETKFDFLYNKTTICNNNRSSDSILCGKCKKGFSLTLGNEECIQDTQCDDKVYTIYWGVPLVIVLVPFLVLLLFCIDVNIFTSYLNAWLYFYQVLPFVVQDAKHLDFIMQGILALTSWRIRGVHFPCFVKGLDNIYKVLSNYLLPFYILIVLWLLVGFGRSACCAWVCNNCCRCFQKLEIPRAISSILVLCFTQLTLISFYVCRWIWIDADTRYFVIQGSIYSSKDGSNVPAIYYVCLVFAILFILCFVTILPLILLFRSLLEGCLSEKCCIVRSIMTHLKGLLDIFQDCFRDGYRWFSAFYFLCRIALLLLTVLPITPGPRKRCMIEIFAVLSLVFFSFCKPYKECKPEEKAKIQGQNNDEDEGRNNDGDEGRSNDGDEGRSNDRDEGRSNDGDEGRSNDGDEGRSNDGDEGRSNDRGKGKDGERGKSKGLLKRFSDLTIIYLQDSPVHCGCIRRKDSRFNSNCSWLNIADTLILTDLCIITLMSSARNSEASAETRISLKYGMWALSWLPMGYFVGLIFPSIWLAISKCCCCICTNAQRVYVQHDVHNSGYENLADSQNSVPSISSG